MKKYCFLFLLFVFLGACSDEKNNKYDFSIKGEDKNGVIRDFSLKDFRGQNLIIYFGYTLCPDICPSAMNIVSGVLDEQIESKNISLNDVKIVFISIDPNRDTPKQTNEYIRYFYENSQALIPTDKQLEDLAKVYGVRYSIVPLPDSELKYSVAHSSSVYVFDRDGNFLGEISNLIDKKIVKKLKDFGILKN